MWVLPLLLHPGLIAIDEKGHTDCVKLVKICIDFYKVLVYLPYSQILKSHLKCTGQMSLLQLS